MVKSDFFYLLSINCNVADSFMMFLGISETGEVNIQDDYLYAQYVEHVHSDEDFTGTPTICNVSMAIDANIFVFGLH